MVPVKFGIAAHMKHPKWTFIPGPMAERARSLLSNLHVIEKACQVTIASQKPHDVTMACVASTCAEANAHATTLKGVLACLEKM